MIAMVGPGKKNAGEISSSFATADACSYTENFPYRSSPSYKYFKVTQQLAASFSPVTVLSP